MASRSGEVTEEFSKQEDLSGIRCTGNSSTGKMDFQSGGAGDGLALCKPGGEGEILDAALAGKDRGAEAVGLDGGENLPLVLLRVTGTTDAIGFDEDVDGLIRDGFHRSPTYADSRNTK